MSKSSDGATSKPTQAEIKERIKQDMIVQLGALVEVMNRGREHSLEIEFNITLSSKERGGVYFVDKFLVKESFQHAFAVQVK